MDMSRNLILVKCFDIFFLFFSESFSSQTGILPIVITQLVHFFLEASNDSIVHVMRNKGLQIH